MNLGPEELGYFITQVGLSAASFGVAKDDVALVGESLGMTFGFRCSPPAVVVPSQGAHTQSICLRDTCMLSPNATCSAYDKSEEPLVANATLAMGQGRNATDSDANPSASMASGSAMPSATGSSAGSIVGTSVSVLAAAVVAVLALAS